MRQPRTRERDPSGLQRSESLIPRNARKVRSKSTLVSWSGCQSNHEEAFISEHCHNKAEGKVCTCQGPESEFRRVFQGLNL